MTKHFLVLFLSWGLTLQGLSPLFAQGAFHSFQDQSDKSKSDLKMDNRQDLSGISVHVLGEVNVPGTYNLKPNDRLLRAL
ncbi:MAG: hypothetical protein JWQ35_1880, partial [Bacteriovoracaceae bacterium]|nr:hypothetical protein [Bacteriovoracaceae bacterium]